MSRGYKNRPESSVEEKCEMYRRQVGGLQAALAREQQKCKELKKLIMDMRSMVPDDLEWVIDMDGRINSVCGGDCKR